VDGDSLIPVRFGLKHSKNGTTTLYVVVDQNRISLEKLGQKNSDRGHQDAVPSNEEYSNLRRSVNYSIADIVKFVNSKDLLRYLPDQMLNEEQHKAKWEAIAETIKTTNDKNDKKYAEYIASGNEIAASRMVKAAAKANGYTIRAYHGRTAEFNVFDKNKIGSGATLFASQGKGFYFTANREVADKYASRNKDTGNVLDAYLEISKPFVFTDKSNTEANKLLNSFAETIGSTFNVSEYSNWVNFEKRTGEVLSRIVKNNGEAFTTFLEKKGYDGIVYTSFNYDTKQSDLTYIVFNSEQIKSADTITYDDNGAIIPLSERFNEKSKDIRYSSRDSLGKTLTPEQQEYFKDSKVRDENGNLLVVYHGSPSEFTVFNKSKIGTHGSSHGHGFYFTENEGLASSYHKKGGQLLKGYLNITNPVAEDKLTIKKNDLVKLIKAICEQEARNLVADDEYSSVTEALRDTFISNYVNTYEMSLTEAYRTVADIIYPTCDNDTDVLGELFNSGARGLALEKTREVLGYDGVIYTNVDGVHEYVAFESNQFKNITNKAPTKSADIRYSSRKSVDLYSKKEYNSFGWARANDVLSAFENERLRSMFADAKTNQSKPPKSKTGEYMISIGEDVDNKIAYMQGEIDNPIITRVLTIDEYDETEIDKARRNIYDLERRGIQQETKGVLRLYRKTDFGSYATYERNVEENERNNIQLGADRGTGRGTAQKAKAILFDDEGNEIKREYRYSRRDRYTSGQVAQIKANLGTGKVYSKASAMKLVSDLAPKIRRRSFDVLSNELWRGLNTYRRARSITELVTF
jgi:hypothetical protein